MHLGRTLVFLSLCAVAACEKAPSMPAGTSAAAPVAAAAPAPAWQAGAALADARAVAIADLLAKPDAHKDAAVRVEGQVTSVCQHRGCWVELSDGNNKLIIKSLDHGIAFPKDGVSRRMVVEGVFRVDAADSCDHGAGHDGHAAAAAEPAHECPKPKLLVEVRRAELAPQS